MDSNYFYNALSKPFQEILQFILLQDPVKVAAGFTLGTFITKFFTKILDNLVRPFIYIIFHIFSKTEFSYNFLGQKFDIGGALEETGAFVLFIIIFYYGFIKYMNKLKEKYDLPDKTSVCQYCKTVIDPSATRCPACTSNLN